MKQNESLGKSSMRKFQSLKLGSNNQGPQFEKQTLHKIQMLKINITFSDQALQQINEVYYRKVERKDLSARPPLLTSYKHQILNKVKLGKRSP